MRIVLSSFGFKHGHPTDADMVWDVRFLPNPYWVDGLREHSGLEPAVAAHVLENAQGRRFLALLEPMIGFLVEQFQQDSNRNSCTLAFGCTGGRHRSVAVTEHVGRLLDRLGFDPHVVHRDIDKS